MGFLFMDESISQDTNIASLTAMYISFEKYQQLRNQFYETLDWATSSEPGRINLNPPELHGRKLLPEIDDDAQRLDAVAQIVDLVVKNELVLFRVGYCLTEKFRKTFKKEHSWLGLCWFGLLSVTQKLYQTKILIPVMDSCPINYVREFSSIVKSADIMRAVDLEHNLSLKNTCNLAEVLYAHSNFSSLTQVVDIVSYLRHVSDWSKCGLPMSDFKRELLIISERLEPCFQHEEIITMSFT